MIVPRPSGLGWSLGCLTDSHSFRFSFERDMIETLSLFASLRYLTDSHSFRFPFERDLIGTFGSVCKSKMSHRLSNVSNKKQNDYLDFILANSRGSQPMDIVNLNHERVVET